MYMDTMRRMLEDNIKYYILIKPIAAVSLIFHYSNNPHSGTSIRLLKANVFGEKQFIRG